MWSSARRIFVRCIRLLAAFFCMAARQSPRSSEGALRRLAASIAKGDPVCCITGAGLSADSGIPTFRHAPNSVWDERTLRYARRDVFCKDPLKWYNEFWLTAFNWRSFASAAPSPGHEALAQIAQKYPSFRVITQNIDNLHERPSACVPCAQYLPVHGRVGKFRCATIPSAQNACPVTDFDLSLLAATESSTAGSETPFQLSAPPSCALCDSFLLPEALLFDEDYHPDVWNRANRWLCESSSIIFVGSSNSVGLTKHVTDLAKENYIPLFNFNLSSSALTVPNASSPVFHVIGPAAATIPAFAARLGIF